MWFAKRYEPSATKIQQTCPCCAREYWLPPSKAKKYRTCGGECGHGTVKAKMASRARPCVTCGNLHTPTPRQLRRGQGRFCSQKCNTSLATVMTPEVQKRAQAGRARRNAISPIAKRGPENPLWTGGPEAAKNRRLANGKAAETNRRYRAANPHKTREWSQKRRGLGRLKRGTIPRLYKAQRERCANCCVLLNGKYHADHIMPIHLGGPHEAANIQLLCQTCNVRKWALHPVEFARRQGKLI